MCGLDNNRHGCMRMPMTPAMMLPVRKLMNRGATFEKSYDGATVFAATLTDRVATTTVNRAKPMTAGLWNLPDSWIGSQIGAPYTRCAAAVMKTASSEKNVIVVGSPSTWPTTCWRWPRPKRVKSGMFSESVDQKAIMPIRDGKKTGQKWLPQPRREGSERIPPKPFALITMKMSSATATTSTKGAAQF